MLALLGAAAGYALGPDGPREAPRALFASAEPVPAAKPGLPVEIFLPDPDDAALKTAIELRTVLLATLDDAGEQSKTQLSVPVPQGWQETRPNPLRWQYTVAGNDPQSYGLRIDILADTGLSAASAMQSRESELRSALLQGSFSDLDITEDRSDGFTAVYVQNGFQRYSIERFYPGPDPDRAFAAVAVYGRARDITGLGDLAERISIDLRLVQKP